MKLIREPKVSIAAKKVFLPLVALLGMLGVEMLDSLGLSQWLKDMRTHRKLKSTVSMTNLHMALGRKVEQVQPLASEELEVEMSLTSREMRMEKFQILTQLAAIKKECLKT